METFSDRVETQTLCIHSIEKVTQTEGESEENLRVARLCKKLIWDTSLKHFALTEFINIRRNRSLSLASSSQKNLCENLCLKVVISFFVVLYFSQLSLLQFLTL